MHTQAYEQLVRYTLPVLGVPHPPWGCSILRRCWGPIGYIKILPQKLNKLHVCQCRLDRIHNSSWRLDSSVCQIKPWLWRNGVQPSGLRWGRLDRGWTADCGAWTGDIAKQPTRRLTCPTCPENPKDFYWRSQVLGEHFEGFSPLTF